MKVLVTELRSQLDPLAVRLHEEAADAEVDAGRMKATRLYSAVVHFDGTCEVWPISAQDARRVVAEFETRREADLPTKATALTSVGPVSIDLAVPPPQPAPDYDTRLVFA